MLEIVCNIFDLTYSIHTQHHNPNAIRLQAALRKQNTNLKIVQKVEFWNQGYRAIQGTKPIAIASLDNSKRFSIKNNKSNALKRYHKVKLNQENVEIA